jgi:hypothetical protein
MDVITENHEIDFWLNNFIVKCICKKNPPINMDWWDQRDSKIDIFEESRLKKFFKLNDDV